MLVSGFIGQWTRRRLEEPTDLSTCLLVFFSVLLFVRLIQFLRDLRRLPPGPWGVPIFGYLPFLKGDTHLHLHELVRRYGPMISARLGNQLVVVLSDHRTIREAFRREEFTGRPNSGFSTLVEGYGIVNSDGKLWKEQRRFLHDRLRRLGMRMTGTGKEDMQNRIMCEVESCLRSLSRSNGEPTDLNPTLSVSISNVICSIIMSVRFKHEDTRFKRYMSLIDEGFKLFSSAAAINFVPVLRLLPGMTEACKKLEQNRDEMSAFFQEIVDSHHDSFDPENIRDIVDSYISEINCAKEEGREKQLFEGKKPDRQIQQILGDLFSAGMETIKTTLQWSVLFMLHHPEVARGVREELDQVVGRRRLPRLEDMPNLPYTECTVLEVMRRSTIVPLGTTHAATRDVNLNGYFIPKDTNVIPLLHAVHMDPTLWEKPEEFKPTRFLNAEGKVTKPEYFLPFGAGRRMCLGDVLARMELFLFFAGLMHTFEFQLPEGETLPSLKGNAGVTISPELYKVCLLRRPAECDFVFNPNSSDLSKLRNVGGQ